MKDQKQVLERVNFLIDALEIDDGVTIGQLVDRIADYCEEYIIIESAILPCFISGFTIRTQLGPYLIVYDQFRSGETKNLVLTHELAHILRGDALPLKPLDKQQAIQAINNTNLADGTLCRSAFTANPDGEKEVELIATFLLQKIKPEQETLFNNLVLSDLDEE